MKENQKIDELIAAGQLEEAVELLGKAIEADGSDDELYLKRGKVYWRLGRRAEATTDYATAAELNPASPAVRALENARDIEAFYNKDLYNP
ncbi:MAG: tetratricopeptide repeat protein [Lachnoclostridium sp.]|nr:tetratricopeptide repeat protein [Lachnoclostridium sp.]